MATHNTAYTKPKSRMRLPQLGKFHRRMRSSRGASEFAIRANAVDCERMMRLTRFDALRQQEIARHQAA